MSKFPYDLLRSDAELIEIALSAYISRSSSHDSATARAMEIVRDELRIVLHETAHTYPEAIR